MSIYKWSDGSKPERSNKKDKDIYIVNSNIKNIKQKVENSDSITKREIANDKLNERELIKQVCDNPFLNDKSYIDVIVNQQQFLTPQNSNF
tara:strand:+ start:805 stop:1077 length:273 start_codon:yes stop_codon:yes gene_type:complete